MRVGILQFILSCLFISISLSVSSQETTKQVSTRGGIIDSLRRSGVIMNENQTKPEISLSKGQAVGFLQHKMHPQFWSNINDPLRLALGQLIYEAVHPVSDSVRRELKMYPFDSLSIPWDKFYIWEPLRIKIPVLLNPVLNAVPDTVASAAPAIADKSDSLKMILAIQGKTSEILQPYSELKDTSIMVVIDTLNEVTSTFSHFPFRYFKFPYQSDSIKAAVSSLLNYLDERDSVIINFTGTGKSVTPIILNSKKGKEIRFWLRNEFSDSMTVWIGNPSRNTIGLYLEQGVNFRRPGRQNNYANPKINVKEIDNTKLQEIEHITLKKQYWKYRNESAFVLNQSALSNWVKGGESSISTALDITEYADYSNKPLKLSSNNFVRLNFGYLESGKDGIRKNVDLLETNSKLNHKAFGKFDFSAILLFKTQVAKGRSYFTTSGGEDTSSIISKFMNPATLTIGLGLDYKPNKHTSLNLSPLSYKGTFVTDPAYMNDTVYNGRIDQTQYGIAKNRKSLNEPGASFMITNEFKPIETVTLVNRLQLFTNYIHNPQNIDIDWEMIATAKLNWFTDVRFNTHLIFDDDTKTDKLENGILKKSARVQFKEMLGFSLSFRF